MRKFRIISLIVTLSLLFTIGINAQTQEPLENFKVGDEVYIVDPIAMGTPNYGSRIITKISGDGVEVQMVGDRFHIRWVTPDSRTLILRPKAFEEFKAGRELAIKMAQDTKYLDSLAVLMGAYNPDFRLNTQFGKMPHLSDTAAWNKVRTDLAELDQLCKTTYKGVKNLGSSVSKNEFRDRFEDHCKIAADRAALEKKTLQLNFEWSQGNGLRDAISDIREQMKKGWIHRDYQLLAIDFELWKKNSPSPKTKLPKNRAELLPMKCSKNIARLPKS